MWSPAHTPRRVRTYSFVSGFNPAAIVHVDAAVLRHRIALWACSSLIALHLPKTREEGEGNRHDISNAIAGFGLRNGWAEEEAAKVLVEAWRVRQAPHGAVRDIARNVESTAWKIRNNEPATGGRKLEELVPGLAGRIAKFMGWERAQLDTSAAPDIGEIGITKALADAVTETEYFAVDIGERLYRYNDGAYRSGGERFIKRRTKELLEQWGKTKTWSSYRANEVIEFLKADARELWLKPPPDEINVQNGILDLSTRKLKDHSPEFLSAVQIPVRYDPAARCEAWEKYIVPCFPSDAPELPYEILANIVAPY